MFHFNHLLVFPIYRSESISFLEYLVSTKRNNSQNEKKMSVPKNQFIITNDNLGIGGAKEKYKKYCRY